MLVKFFNEEGTFLFALKTEETDTRTIQIICENIKSMFTLIDNDGDENDLQFTIVN